jgi:muramoyltetrapeptide carboxypeptidase LdcA involved in peptidoglycan recycling
MRSKRPRRLAPGDVVAVLSPSWGGPSLFPLVYERGLEVLRRWGLRVREYPTTRAPADALERDARGRARDLDAAFADPEVRAIFASIGGEDSIRLLPHVHGARWAEDPKILVGFSDTTTILVHGFLHGLVTFYGPSIMAGFAQMDALPGFEAHVHELLFAPGSRHEYRPYGQFCEGYPDWADAALVGQVKPLRPDGGWRVLQGAGRVQGELLGGCVEVLEWLKGTPYAPGPEAWAGKIVFLETSEEKPSIDAVRRWMRSYGVAGLFARAAAVVFGRARDYTDEDNAALDKMLVEVIGGDFEAPALPVVTGLDFGHTDPQWLLPLGVRAELDLDVRALRLVEPWLE